MDLRRLASMFLFVLTASALSAQEVRFNPINPTPDDSVEATFQVVACGFIIPVVGVEPPTSTDNGHILLGATSQVCTPAEPQSVTVSLGHLPIGVYEVRTFTGGDSPTLTSLVVSRTGVIAGLATVPARPMAGQPVTVAIDSLCPLQFKPARLVTGPGGPTILLEQDLDSPAPPVPCTTTPSYHLSLPLPTLELPQLYELRILTRDGASLSTETGLFFLAAPLGSPLSLQQGRFRVWVDWSAPGFPKSPAVATPLADESGYFSFTSPGNIELVIKILNGCVFQFNFRYWVFIAGLTDLEVQIWVEDTATGRIELYENAAGTAFKTVTDTGSFRCF